MQYVTFTDHLSKISAFFKLSLIMNQKILNNFKSIKSLIKITYNR